MRPSLQRRSWNGNTRRVSFGISGLPVAFFRRLARIIAATPTMHVDTGSRCDTVRSLDVAANRRAGLMRFCSEAFSQGRAALERRGVPWLACKRAVACCHAEQVAAKVVKDAW